MRADSGSTAKRRASESPAASEGAGATEGASSRITWALVPVKPNRLTPAMRGRSVRSQATDSSTTRTGMRSHGMCGEGLRKFRCLGFPLMFEGEHDQEDAGDTRGGGLRWPMLVLAEPISSGRPASRP